MAVLNVRFAPKADISMHIEGDHRPRKVRPYVHRIAGAGVPSDQCVTGTISTLIASGHS
jgi:hypothetical protein